MNKARILTAAALAGLLAFSTGAGALAAGKTAQSGTRTKETAQLSVQEAEAAALEHAGVTEDEVAYLYSEKDYEKGRAIYDIEFVTQDYREYDYEIDAADGSVVGYDFEAENHFYSRLSPEERTAKVTEEEARNIALAHAGKTEKEVTFLMSNADMDDGQAVYEVEFMTGDGAEYDYEISAYTGEVIQYDYDAEYRAAADKGGKGQANGAAAAQSGDIGLEGAKAAALEQAGLSAEAVSRLRAHKDYDDGRVQYEGSFYYDDKEYDFAVDAASGQILEWDVESIYD